MTSEAAAGQGPDSRLVHATCIRLGEHGVLLTGASGSGKSDLALRLIDQAGCGTGGELLRGRLVADDQVLVERQREKLVASPPPSLAGFLEIRGLGIVRLDHERRCELHLAVRLGKTVDLERLPELSRSVFSVLSIDLPEIGIDPWTASAPARVRSAVVTLLRRGAELAR